MAFNRFLSGARLRAVTLSAAVAIGLTGCNFDFLDNGKAGNGDKTGGEPPASGGNRAPTIGGTPPTSAKVATPYDFTPQASDPDGDALRFEITGRPSWATFDPNTGRLYGTPPAGLTGSTTNIVIAVTDGQARAQLPAFAISILDASGNGSAQLSWSKPTTNTDGSPLTDLAGYRIYYGRLPDSPSDKLEIASPDTTSATIGKLSTGTWYFSIATYTTSGVESERTRPVWTSI